MYNPDKAFEYLKPIIDFAEQSIPARSHKATSIYVLATAGMRLLDKETQLEIMNDLVEDFKTENSFASFKTQVISGASEGMYQWITVNSIASRFNSNANLDQNNKDSSKTYGLIEMGGASIQVTYQLKNEFRERVESKLLASNEDALKAFKDQIIEPKISHEAKEFDYKLVSTTFLGFGSNSARLAYIDLLITRHVKTSHLYQEVNKIFGLYTRQKPLLLKDSCLPAGSSETVLRPTRILTLKEPIKQTVGFNIEEDDITFSVRLDGTGHYEECRQSLVEMLDRAKRERLNCKKEESSCTMSLIGTDFIPFKDFEFLGLSDFYYTTKEMIDKAGKYDRAPIVEKTKEICSVPYKKLVQLYPEANKHDKTRVLKECFKAIWVEVFLQQALNMPDDYEKFETVGKIKGDEIDWTLGAVLDNSLSMELAATSNEEDDDDYDDDEDDDKNDG